MTTGTRIKVMGFDGWTAGSKHFTRLLEAFNRNGIDLFLVHLGSWGEDKNRPPSETINGMEVRDIKYYTQQNLRFVLDAEKPDAVLFLSTETFLHRAMLRYCRQRGIPTIHLTHGVINTAEIEQEIGDAFEVNYRSLLPYLLTRAKKFFRRTFFVYSASLLRTGASIAEWKRFFYDASVLARGKFIQKPARDSMADMFCVYIPADRYTGFFKWGYSPDAMPVVGNPDLAVVNMTEKDLGSFQIHSDSHHRTIVYIDAGISSHATNFASDHHYVKYLIHCSQEVAKMGFQLQVKLKPHPDSRYQYLKNKLEAKGISLIDNSELLSSLHSARCCIIEPSTMSLLPCLIGMPVFLNKIGPLASVKFSAVFQSYPRGRYLNDYSSIETGLTQLHEQFHDSAKLFEWIRENSGPLPSHEMPQRVAKAVLELVKRKI